MNRINRRTAFFGWVLALSILLLLPTGAQPGQGDNDPLTVRTARRATSGKALYTVACAACHGLKGDGWAWSGSPGFEFPSTNFRAGVYKFRSTDMDSLPTDEDLVRSIRNGMPGTEMVPFGRILSETSIRAVADYIKSFTPEFADSAAPSSGEGLIAVPGRTRRPSDQSVAEGKALYKRELCDTCHGPDGDGRGADAAGMTDDWERPLRMLDWREGQFKSGYEDRDLYRTTAAGMRGTPMEGYAEDLTSEELWSMVDFIRSVEKKEGGWLGKLFGDDPSGLNYAP